MEFKLSDPPTYGYGPGDTVSGEIKYNIAAQQETILDVRLHLDGSLLISPSKLKYEAHRSNTSLVKESQTPFQGPFTLKRQLLAICIRTAINCSGQGHLGLAAAIDGSSISRRCARARRIQHYCDHPDRFGPHVCEASIQGHTCQAAYRSDSDRKPPLHFVVSADDFTDRQHEPAPPIKITELFYQFQHQT
mgnify:CR=1 FL=1